jgi:hypothetical protein
LQSLLTQGTTLLAEGEAQLAGEEQGVNGAIDPKATDAEQAQPAKSTNSTNSTSSISLISSAGSAGSAGLAKETANGSEAAVDAAVRQGADTAVARSDGGASRAIENSAAAPSPAANANAAPAGAARATEQAARSLPGGAQALASAGDAAEGDTPAAAQASGPKPEAAWIGRFLQWLGVGHEHQLMHPAEARLPGDDAGLPAGAAAAAASEADATAPEARPAADTLKGALLALAAHDDVPPALREAAQTLANQVTGQQLLLSSDRSTVAPFSHMTLFVPMKGADGETTATVHVQTRRSRRGEWDVDNCHLLFDLRMRNLGDTIVDVQVVDRIVSLKLLNDFPGMSDLLDQAREELASGMSSAGFQLLSLTASPLPQWKNGSAASALSSSGADKTAIASAYAAKPYKGVDYRA